MKAKREQQSAPIEIERFREELGLRIARLAVESLQAWPACDNLRCRRAKRCASADRECIANRQQSLPPVPPAEKTQRLDDFRRDLLAHQAGPPPGEPAAKAARAKKPREPGPRLTQL